MSACGTACGPPNTAWPWARSPCMKSLPSNMAPSCAMRSLGGLRYGCWVISRHFAAADPQRSARRLRPDAAARAAYLRLLVRVAGASPGGSVAPARVRFAYDAARRPRSGSTRQPPAAANCRCLADDQRNRWSRWSRNPPPPGLSTTSSGRRTTTLRSWELHTPWRPNHCSNRRPGRTSRGRNIRWTHSWSS